eukprot:COSAG02_NODE_6300_length_3669_cov_2.392437_4_plen_193_part_00
MRSAASSLCAPPNAPGVRTLRSGCCIAALCSVHPYQAIPREDVRYARGRDRCWCRIDRRAARRLSCLASNAALELQRQGRCRGQKGSLQGSTSEVISSKSCVRLRARFRAGWSRARTQTACSPRQWRVMCYIGALIWMGQLLYQLGKAMTPDGSITEARASNKLNNGVVALMFVVATTLSLGYGNVCGQDLS